MFEIKLPWVTKIEIIRNHGYRNFGRNSNQRNETSQDVRRTEKYFNVKTPDPNFDRMKRFRCFEFGNTTHFRPNCRKLKNRNILGIVNNIRNSVDV